MGLLNLWAIGVGTAALVLPVLIHWLTRPRPMVLPLSTIRFVQDAMRQRRARYRLRDWIVLALRTLAIALLGLGFAQPLLGARPTVVPQAGPDSVRLIILDASQSMAAESGGVSAFERARGVAARYLSSDGGWVNLIVAAAQPRAAMARMSNNVGEMRRELSEVQPLPQRCDVAAAISLAADMLAHAPASAQAAQLVIVSDFQRSDWAAVDFSPLPKQTVIRLESVAAPRTPANLGILRVGAAGRVEVGRESQLQVDVGNFSPAGRDVQVTVRLGDVTYRLSGLCPAGATTTLSAPLKAVSAGWLSGVAKLEDAGDALPADDSRPIALLVHPTPVYPLITRQPAGAKPISSYYLERALVPGAATPVTAKPVLRMDPDSLDREALRGGELIVVDHPGRLSSSAVAMLCDLVRRGQGMLYVASEAADATNLQLLADAAGSDLKMPVAFYPASPQQPRRNLFMAEVQGRQSPFNVFSDGLSTLIQPLRFSGGLGSRTIPGGVSDEVLATYNDRSACLVVTALGAGRLGVLNADLSESNLPASPAFVPMLGELANLLMGQQLDQPAYSGERLRRYLPAGSGSAEGLSVTPDPNSEPRGEFVGEAGAVVWDWKEAGPPDVYSVVRDGRTLLAVATGIPPSESDLTSLDMSVLKDRLSGGRSVEVGSLTDADSPLTGDRAWAWVLAGCVVCVVLELMVLRLFRT